MFSSVPENDSKTDINKKETDVYFPELPLEFDSNNQLSIFECSLDVLKTPRRGIFYALPISFFGSITYYKAIYSYTSIIWPILSCFPVLFFFNMLRSVHLICLSTPKEIFLHRNGTKIDVVDVIGKRNSVNISEIRVPTDTELTLITANSAAFVGKI